MRLLIFVLFVSFVVKSPVARAAEPFFKPGDVVAFVGGEDMVVAAELGYIETLFQRALPDYKLRFRSLAWEGDTVFEQQRDLNYPKLEVQLDKIGATVVIFQFGQMESLAGKEKLPEFIAAYEKLIARLSGGGKHRFVFVRPSAGFPAGENASTEEKLRTETRTKYGESIEKLASKVGAKLVICSERTIGGWSVGLKNNLTLNHHGHSRFYEDFRVAFELSEEAGLFTHYSTVLGAPTPKSSALCNLVVAKNKLWFNYYRPQNWAFLAGDCTNQPSSRDHKDPSKRWFPEELEKFIPLIEAKEQEIWALAEKLSKEGGAK